MVETLYHDPFKQPKQYIHVQGKMMKCQDTNNNNNLHQQKELQFHCQCAVHCYPTVRTGSSNTCFFFVTPPSGRGLVIPVFFFVFVFFFCRGQLPQTCARSKQYLPVNFVRSAFIRQNFHESWCRKLPAI